MTTYTVKIEASGGNGIWQAMAPAETIEDDGTAEELASFVAGNQTVAKSGTWRVRVWVGDDTGVEPAAEYERPESEVADELLAALTRVTARRARLVEELDAQRDSLVRELMGTSAPRGRIASAAGVKEARLYQIRDGRR